MHIADISTPQSAATGILYNNFINTLAYVNNFDYGKYTNKHPKYRWGHINQKMY